MSVTSLFVSLIYSLCFGTSFAVKLNKPQLTIQKDGHNLRFQTNKSDLDEFGPHCYIYKYKYSKCDKVNHVVFFLYVIV